MHHHIFEKIYLWVATPGTSENSVDITQFIFSAVNKEANTFELLLVWAGDLVWHFYVMLRKQICLHQNLRTETDPSVSTPGRLRLEQVSLNY